MARIACYLDSPYQRSLLEPIRNELQATHDCRFVDSPADLVAMAPQVVVLSDNFDDQFTRMAPGAQIVWTRHGFASKRYVGYSMSWCDYACLNSDWVVADYAARGFRARKASWVTGFIGTDALHRALAAGRSNPRPTLLYAPTFQMSLNSLELLGRHWTMLLRARCKDLQIWIKPHPHFSRDHPQWLARYASWAERDALVRVFDPATDIHPLMAQADVMLTDASSVMFYFLATDKPIVLVDNPDRFEDERRFDPDGYEWTWRDMGTRVDNVDAMVAAVERALSDPTREAQARARYRERVFGDCFDGRVAQRIAAHVQELVA